MGRSNFGGSILPSHNPGMYGRRPWARGDLEIKPLPDVEEHALVIHGPRGASILAVHPNGYSVAELQARMLRGDIERALAQFDYILACGGLACDRARFLELVES